MRVWFGLSSRPSGLPRSLWLFGVGLIMAVSILSPAPVLACGGACSNNSNDPLSFIHFWYLQGSNPPTYWYGDYQFDCNGNVYMFCPLDAFVNPISNPATPPDMAPQSLSYHCECNAGTAPDRDK